MPCSGNLQWWLKRCVWCEIYQWLSPKLTLSNSTVKGHPSAQREQVQIMQFAAQFAASPLSPGGGLPISYVRKTSHTCLLVSGEFLSGIVFPTGACFSRLKHDDVCMCVALPLQQIGGGGDRLNLQLWKPVLSDTYMTRVHSTCCCPWQPA